MSDYAGKLWVTFVDVLAVPLDLDVHCTDDAAMMAFTMEETEGTNGAPASFTRKQTGWKILGSAMPEGILVVESATGLKEDAFVRARIRISGAPGDLFSARQELVGVCAPADIDAKILAWVKANHGSRPQTDFLISDTDPEDIESYMMGYSGTIHVDPATHAISYNDFLDGDRVIDVTDLVSWKVAPPTDGAVDEGGPVKRIVYKLQVNLVQEAKGRVDIAGKINDIVTYSSDFGAQSTRDLPDGLIDISAAGWSHVEGGSLVRVNRGETQIKTGRRIRTTYRPWTYMAAFGGGVERVNGALVKTIRHEFDRLVKWTYDIVHLWMAYDISQAREEHAYYTLDVPVQSSAVVSEESELVELQAGDLYADLTAPAHDESKPYLEGERCTFGGQVYKAVEDIPPQPFWQKRPNQVVIAGGSQHPYWESTPSNAALPRRGAYEFLPTDRGQELSAHIFCRMRKEARKRMRGRTITMTFRWQDVRDITMHDEIRFEVPFDDRYAPAIGKVIGIKRTWPAKGQPTIVLTVAVPIGTADAGEASQGTTRYAYDDYIEDYFESPDNIGTGLDDVLWSWDADPVARPIEVGLLENATYAVPLPVRTINPAGEQYAAAWNYGQAQRDPRFAIRDNQTRIKVEMRPLVAEDVLIREFDFGGELLVGKRGFDFTNGGEP